MTPGASLRQLLAAGPVVAPGAWDAMSARLVEAAGFSAAFLSGAAVAASRLGLPDLGHLGATDIMHAADTVSGRVGLPLVVDADTGFGGVLQVQRTVRGLERIGAAAVVIEDQVAPQRCGAVSGVRVVDESEFRARILAAVDARKDMLVVARTDARGEHGLDAAIDRAGWAGELGADLVFASRVVAPDDVAAISAAAGVPVVVNLSEAATPAQGWPALDSLANAGGLLQIAPVLGLVAAATAICSALDGLATGGTAALREPSEWEALTDLLGLPDALETERRWSRPQSQEEHP